MGIIKAAINSIGGSFADQWLEYIKAGSMDSQTVMSAGVKVRGRDKRNENKEGSADFVSDGSLIEVGVNQFMILTDGGKIVDYTSEPGYYKVDNKNAPSMFNGDFRKRLRRPLTACVLAEFHPAPRRYILLIFRRSRILPSVRQIQSTTSITSIMPSCICAPTVISLSELLTQLNSMRKRFRKIWIMFRLWIFRSSTLRNF